MNAYPPVLQNLIRRLSRLPGLGEKSATRIALHLLRAPGEEAVALADAIQQMKNQIWSIIIDKAELNNYKDKYKVISAKVVEGKVLLHIKSDSIPDANFSVVEPDLEDVYFSNIL